MDVIADYFDKSIATYNRDSAANDFQLGHLEALKVAKAELATVPIPMLLFCPSCGHQHVDKPEPEAGWDNPPHKSHLCRRCGCIWRPADIPTTGVPAIETKGSADTWSIDGEAARAAEVPAPEGRDEHPSNAFDAWLADRCDTSDPEALTSGKELFEDFDRWARARDVVIGITAKHFVNALRERGFDRVKARLPYQPCIVTCCRGLRLVEVRAA